jgi:hypothetical protein
MSVSAGVGKKRRRKKKHNIIFFINHNPTRKPGCIIEALSIRVSTAQFIQTCIGDVNSSFLQENHDTSRAYAQATLLLWVVVVVVVAVVVVVVVVGGGGGGEQRGAFPKRKQRSKRGRQRQRQREANRHCELALKNLRAHCHATRQHTYIHSLTHSLRLHCLTTMESTAHHLHL